MEITIFAKKRTTAEGKSFYGYLTTLTKKSGETITVGVKFKDPCKPPKPEECPMNIMFEKTDGNLSSRVYTREDNGESVMSYTLWLSNWKQGGEYVDHSLDDFV